MLYHARMRQFFSCLNLFYLILAGAFCGAASAAALPDFSALVERVSPSVVNISTSQREALVPGAIQGVPPAPDEVFEAATLGSGFIISADGFVLTNYHVVRGAEEIIVKLSDRRQLPARVIGVDPPSDLALLKIAATDLPVAARGSAQALKVGEWVMAIGSPFGFDHSVTVGIVSAKGRSVGEEQYVPFIQTDVAINPGNSGGPLFNLAGEVVGVNSQIYSRTGGFMGVSFAIPIDLAMEVADQLREEGQVQRGWLGVNVQDVTRELAESFHMQRPEGALVRGVMKDSPAARAGIRVGDVILSFNQTAVLTADVLPPVVGRSPVGKPLPLTVLRDGKRLSLQANLGVLAAETLASWEAAETDSGRLGLVVRDLRDEERATLGVTEGGVLVEQVSTGPGRAAGIQPGDVLLRLDQKPVEGAGQFARLVETLPVGKAIAILLQRQGEALFVALRLDGR